MYRDHRPTWHGHLNSQLFCPWARLGLRPSLLVALEVVDRMFGKERQDAVMTPVVDGKRYVKG